MGIRPAVCLVLTTMFAVAARAQSPTLLHELFQDHAVLQRDQPIAVWGQAAANEAVSVSLAGATARAQADRARSLARRFAGDACRRSLCLERAGKFRCTPKRQ